MPVNLKLGRRPAVLDVRVPFLRDVTTIKQLPPAPAWANWYAGEPSWPMLGNDSVSDCLQAAIGHAVQQFRTYTRDAEFPMPTDAEAVAFYSASTGYNPADPTTDQGSYVMGPNGVMQYWATKGAMFGGTLSKVQAYVQVHKTTNAEQWRQAIHYFGGLLVGISLPQSILAADTVPYVWEDASGPIAGGHEIWVCGYQQVAGQWYFDFISWGARYRATQAFLDAVTDEAVAVYDTESINGRGLNPDDFTPTQLFAAMRSIRAMT